MATIYEVKVVSHWANLNPKRLAEIIKEAIKDGAISYRCHLQSTGSYSYVQMIEFNKHLSQKEMH